MNEIFLTIIFTIAALFEITPALYVLIADRNSPGNRALTLFFTALALNSLSYSALIGSFSLEAALPWIGAFVITTYMIGPAMYLAALAVLRPRWLRHGWLRYPVYLLLALPLALVLADATGLSALLFPGPLLFTPPSAQVYAGGVIPLEAAAAGRLHEIMGIIQISIPLLTLICPLAVVGVRDWKRNPAVSRVAWLFFAAALVASLPLWLPPGTLSPVNAAMVTSFALIAGFGISSFWSTGIPWSLAKIRQALNNWPIFAKLVLVVVTVFVPSVIIITLVSASIVRNNITSQIGTSFNALARLEARSIAENLQTQISNMERLSQSPVLLSTLNLRDRETGDLEAAEARTWLNVNEAGWVLSDLSMVQQVPAGFLSSISVLNDFRRTFPLFTYLQLTDSQGGLMSATDTPTHFDYSNSGWWRATYNQGRGQVYISVPLREPETQARYVQIALPVMAKDGRTVVGVLMGRYAMNEILGNLASIRIGAGGHSDLFSPGGIFIPLAIADDPHGIAGGQGVSLDWPELLANPSPWQILPYDEVSSVVSWTTIGETVASASPVAALQWRITIHQPVSEALLAITTAQRATLLTTVITTTIGFAFAWLLSGFITRPLISLTSVAQRMLEGDLNVQAEVPGKDEIGVLASTFNSMTEQVRGLVSGLEAQVASRTADLERQTEKLQAATHVGQTIISILKVDDLIQAGVDVIQDRFGLYYVGLFLMGEDREWAILQAATGDAGEKMRSRGHRIRVGEGMIGWSIQNARARVAGDAAADIVRLVTPELPETRSEAAIPVRARGQTIGALSVQSTRPDEFDTATISILQTVGDQIGIAIDNANLLEENRAALLESQQALETVRRTYQQVTREAWTETGHRQHWDLKATPEGIIWKPPGSRSAPEREASPRKLAPGELAVPIKIRDYTAGTIRLRKREDSGPWTAAESQFVETYVSQLGQALDSARLFQDIQSRSVQLQASAEVGRAATSILELEELLPAAVNLIGERFQLYYAGIFLLDEQEKWAVLQAGTGQAGRKQVESGHKLELGGQSMVGQCISTGEARIAIDVGEEAVHFDNPLLPDTRTEMALPLIAAGRTTGALTIQSTRPAAFTRDDIVVFQTMANQLATAVQNARLYEQSQQATMNAQEQRRIADALLKSAVRFAETQVQSEILRIIVEEIDEQIRPDQVNIFLCRLPEEDFDLAYRFASGDPEDDYQQGQRVLGEERPDLLQIIKKLDHNYKPEARADGLIHEQYRLPLLLANQPIGAVEVFHTARDAHIRVEDRAVIDGIIQQASVALQSAQAFQQTQEALARTDALYRVGQAAAKSQSLPLLLQSIADTIAETLPADRVQLVTLDTGEHKVTHCMLNGAPPGSLKLPVYEDLMSGLTGQAIRDGKPVSAPKGQPDPRESQALRIMRQETGAGGLIIVPLMVRDRVLGAITVMNRADNVDFSEQDSELLYALAIQTAVAIQNSELFEETQKTADNERLLNQIGSQLIQSLDFETILRTAVEAIGQLPNITDVTLTVGDTRTANGGHSGGSASLE